MTCLTRQERRRGYWKTTFAETYAFHETAAFRKLLGRETFFKFQKPEKLYLTPTENSNDCVLYSKRAFLEQQRCATRIIFSFSDKRAFMKIQEEWFKAYITEDISCIHDCNIAELTDNDSCMKSKRVMNDENGMSVYVAMIFIRRKV